MIATGPIALYRACAKIAISNFRFFFSRKENLLYSALGSNPGHVD